MVFNRLRVVFFRGILSSVEQLARELPKVRLCYYYVSKLMTDSKKGLSILTHLPWIHAAYQQHLDLDTRSTHLCQKLGRSDEIFHFSPVAELRRGHTISTSYLQRYTDPISSEKSQHPSTRESLVELDAQSECSDVKVSHMHFCNLLVHILMQDFLSLRDRMCLPLFLPRATVWRLVSSLRLLEANVRSPSCERISPMR